MNSSIIIQLLSNGKNSTAVFQDLASAWSALGYNFTIQMIYLTIYMVISIVGLIGNFFSVFIFYRPAFNYVNAPPLFAFLRYESIIDFVGNLIGAIFAFYACANLLPFVNNYPSQWLQGYIVIPVYTVAYYAKFLIEIVIVLDRIIILVPSVGTRFKLNYLVKSKRPYLVFISIWIFSFLINFPYFYPIPANPTTSVLVNYGYPGCHVYTYYSSGRNNWSSWGNPGYYIMIAIYIFKNGITFFVETALNVVSLILFQRYLAYHNSVTINGLVSRRAKALNHIHTQGSGSVQPVRDIAAEQHNNTVDTSAGGRNMANLVLTQTVSSFIHDTLLLSYTLNMLINPKQADTSRILQLVSTFATAVRHSINFLQFYFFNSKFREEVCIVLMRMKLGTKVAQQPAQPRF
jgi:hypothetical protein